MKFKEGISASIYTMQKNRMVVIARYQNDKNQIIDAIELDIKYDIYDIKGNKGWIVTTK